MDPKTVTWPLAAKLEFLSVNSPAKFPKPTLDTLSGGVFDCFADSLGLTGMRRVNRRRWRGISQREYRKGRADSVPVSTILVSGILGQGDSRMIALNTKRKPRVIDGFLFFYSTQRAGQTFSPDSIGVSFWPGIGPDSFALRYGTRAAAQIA